MLTVCNYHYIREDFTTKYPSIFGMTPLQLKKQLIMLKKEGRFISSSQLLKDTDEVLRSRDNFILITFDDGLKEQVDYGLSVLNELEIPALFFVNSINYQENKVSTVHKIHLLRSLLDSEIILKSIYNKFSDKLSNLSKSKIASVYIYDDEKTALLKYVLNFVLNHKEQEEIINKLFINYFEEEEELKSLYMSVDNLKQLAELNYLGSHTHSHYPLGLFEKDCIEKELKSSKVFLEDLTMSKIETVAYPYGTKEACSNEVAKEALNVGYKLGFTTNRGVNNSVQNKLLLNRFDCNDLIGGKKITYDNKRGYN